MMAPASPSPEPVDDYQIDRDLGRSRRSAIDHILALARGLLLLIIAALSFAVFWVTATLLGLI